MFNLKSPSTIKSGFADQEVKKLVSAPYSLLISNLHFCLVEYGSTPLTKKINFWSLKFLKQLKPKLPLTS